MGFGAKLKAISFLLFVTLHFLIPVLSQNNFPSDPMDHNAANNKFYLTSKSDCSDDLKNIFDSPATVLGYDLSNIGTGPTTCTIRLTSESVYTGTTLQIDIIAMDINDCDVQLAMYDGQGTTKLDSYDCHSSQLSNRRFHMTSGNTVTFIMSRRNSNSHSYDIEIRVTPIRGGIDPDNDRYNHFSFQKFEQEAIVGMIGGFYALVIIICLAIVFYCNIKYRGLNKTWETHQLATMKTDTTFDGRSQVSQPPWSVASQSRGPVSTYARSYTTTDPYSRKGAQPRSEDGSSVVYDHDEKFQQRNLMNDERDRHRGRDRMASQNNTYSDDEEDPDNFKEKVITPRVKTSGASWKPQDRNRRNRDREPPPSFEEATRARSSSEEESEEETEESSDNDSTRKRLTTSSEGDSDDYSETETESESSYASSSRRGRGARAKRPKKKNDDRSKAKARVGRRRQSSTDDASSQRTSEPRKNGRRAHPGHHPQQPAMPYGAYPAPAPGGQFVPVMAGHPQQFQAVPMMPPSYPPPQYPTEPAHQPTQGSNIKPTDPPIYSYLVRRGYNPLDPSDPNNRQNSPAGSVASSQRAQRPAFREEPDTPLQSGVEYMRR